MEYMHMQSNGDETSILHEPCIVEMWANLRSAAIFYLRHYSEPKDASSSEIKAAFVEDSKRAAEALWRYSVLAEDHFGHLLCKSNLHKLNCILPRQQLARGHAAWCAEYWVEMMVQDCKRFTKFLTTKTPELLLVNQLLLQGSLHRTSAEHQGLKTFDDLVPSWGGDPEVVRGSCMDTFETDGLLGTGARIKKTDETSEVAAVVAQLYKDFPGTVGKVDSVTGEDVHLRASDMLRYTYASRGGFETIHSEMYRRARTRESFYVQVRYEEDNGSGGFDEVLYVGKVRYFLGALEGGADTDEDEDGADVPTKVALCLRIAVSDLWVAHKKKYPTGDILEVEDMAKPKELRYPVELQRVDCKLVRCQPLKDTGLDLKRGYFVLYSHNKFDRY
jgi:hypothetical protein